MCVITCKSVHCNNLYYSAMNEECGSEECKVLISLWFTACLCYTAALEPCTGVLCMLCVSSMQLNAALSEHTVQLSVVSVYESDTGPRATFLIEFLDPNINVTAVEANLNIVTQVPEPQRRRRQVSQPVRLQPDISQSQGFIVSSKQWHEDNCKCSDCTEMRTNLTPPHQGIYSIYSIYSAHVYGMGVKV